MRTNSEHLKFLIIGLCLLSSAYFYPLFIPPRISQAIGDFPYWYTYFLSKRALTPLKIVGIAIDEYSLSRIPQRWPFRRTVYAQLIDILGKNGVNTVSFDLVFSGESDIKEDDEVFASTLKNATTKIVLAGLQDEKTKDLILPLKSFVDSAAAVGIVNTPSDKDGRVRRLRPFIQTQDHQTLYSFTLQVASAFLNQPPQRVIPAIPLLKDNTFFINYLFRPKDILKVSLYDTLENLDNLKKEYGQDFLQGALVIVYAEAEIIHDILQTPFGYMPGGLVNINGVAEIILNRFIREAGILSLIFLVISFFAIFYFLRYLGFLQGLLLLFGLFFIELWIQVALSLKGWRFDYVGAVIFGLLFFTGGSLYKYTYFLTQLLKIKDKATLDPLRGLFTLRYFYYRLELELENVRLGRGIFLVFLHLGSFKEALIDKSLEEIGNIWEGLREGLALKGSFWSVYTQEELAGCVIASAQKMGAIALSLKNNLEAILHERGLSSQIKVGYFKMQKKYSPRQLLYVLFNELNKKEGNIVGFKESDLSGILSSAYPFSKKKDGFLDTFSDDIEEKNRQLLLLIDELNKEQAKNKEAFFEIISSLVNALEARDPYTQGHSQRVCNYSLMLAERLGWSREEKEKLKKAALLHDLGKIGIPDAILHKKGALNAEEYDFIKKHEVIGVKILQPLKEMQELLPWILYHHERWDGKGYPHGLAGKNIPLGAQIISLADVFDALTTGRDYKKAFPYAEAIKEIVRNKGTQFNPELADIFVPLPP